MSKTNKIQSRQVRDVFLDQMPEAMTRLINYASGFDVLEDGSRGDYNGELAPDILLQLTNKAIPMMTLEDDQTSEVDLKRANTIEELMDMRREGLISDRQLKQYTDIMKTNYEITELSHLLEKLEELDDD